MVELFWWLLAGAFAFAWSLFCCAVGWRLHANFISGKYSKEQQP